MADAPQTEPSVAWQARMLLRASRAGTLATSAGGQPFASLVTPACAPDLSVLMLLSSLSAHTQHLRAEPRCAIMVQGVPESRNPQTAPRLTITGIAEPEPEPALKARWLAVHPYAQLYADFGDFSLWRVRPLSGLLVGGFARANRLSLADLTLDADAIGALADAEAGILSHCNADHPDALALIAGTQGDWRMIAADVDGFDLALDEEIRRIPWSKPVSHAGEVRAELVRMTRAARFSDSVH